MDAIEGVGRPDVLLEDGKGLDGSAGADGKERLVAQTERGDRVGACERDGVLGRDEEAVDDRLCAKGRARIGAEDAVDEVERVKAEASQLLHVLHAAALEREDAHVGGRNVERGDAVPDQEVKIDGLVLEFERVGIRQRCVVEERDALFHV